MMTQMEFYTESCFTKYSNSNYQMYTMPQTDSLKANIHSLKLVECVLFTLYVVRWNHLWKCYRLCFMLICWNCIYQSLFLKGYSYWWLLILFRLSIWKCLKWRSQRFEMFTHCWLKEKALFYHQEVFNLWKCILSPKCHDFVLHYQVKISVII